MEALLVNRDVIALMVSANVSNPMSCDLVHNMCGWFLQFNDGGRCHRAELRAVSEEQAVFAAFDLGFDEMEIWDFEQHIKCVRIPKGKHDFNSVYNRA